MKQKADRRKKRSPAETFGAELNAIAVDDALGDAARKHALLERLRSWYRDGLEEAESKLKARAQGYQVSELICQQADVLIRTLYQVITEHLYPVQNPTEAERLSVIAVGGYGRGHLAPHSDIDLLFLMPYRQTAWGESVVEYMLYLLWDLGLKVGHATRTVEHCLRLARQDLTIRTAILEKRYLAGDRDLFEELRTRFAGEIVVGTTREFVEAKLQERAARHARAGDSRYLVEPDVKDGKGGLRDLNSLFWIAKYAYQVETARELVRAGLFTKDEYRTFLKAYSFLSSVRCHLHFLTGRAEERLTFDVQPEMAERLGYTDRAGQPAVERFMKHYFLVAKDVGALTRIFCASLETAQAKKWPRLGRLLRFAAGRKPLHEGFRIEGGRLNVTGPGVYKTDPVNLLRLFYIADQNAADIHPDALKYATRSLGLIDKDLRKDPQANELFLKTLTSRRDPEWALRRMCEAGVLGKFVPDFGRVEAMMQFNMYHHYTVDEHIIRAIGILSRIEKGGLADENPLADEIVHKVFSRPVLYIALFLHDIAKGRPEDHSLVGSRLARRLCPRLGCTNVETEAVAWLVENHLVMSDFAQSRDIFDPKTIKDFTHIVQSPGRLRLLLVLTVADIRAVGPGVWNGWKGQLLRDLYHASESVLQGGEAPGGAASRETRVRAAQDALAARLGGWSKDRRELALTRHSESYWLSFGPDVHQRHADIMRQADEKGQGAALDIRIDSFKSITEIAIYSDDKPGLFSRLALAFTVSGATIMDAKAFTTLDGKALDVFYVQDAAGAPFSEHSRLTRLRRAIEQAADATLAPERQFVPPKLRPRERAFSVEPQVLIDNQASEIHTLIEINGRDRPGLLYLLTSTLGAMHFTVASAHISTYGERAVDVFYVKDRAGFKVTNKTSIEAIKEALLKVLAADQSANQGKAAE